LIYAYFGSTHDVDDVDEKNFTTLQSIYAISFFFFSRSKEMGRNMYHNKRFSALLQRKKEENKSSHTDLKRSI
jgi:hypothetical protein